MLWRLGLIRLNRRLHRDFRRQLLASRRQSGKESPTCDVVLVADDCGHACRMMSLYINLHAVDAITDGTTHQAVCARLSVAVVILMVLWQFSVEVHTVKLT